MELTELKYAITGIKNSLDKLNRRVEMKEDTISACKDRVKEFNQSKQQRENRLTKKNKALETCVTVTKDPTFISSEFWKERRKRVG